MAMHPIKARLIQKSSPNFDDRGDKAIDYVILHGTWMNSVNDALERLCDESSKVSAHYVIDETGLIYQLVEEDKRAWHAGISYWQGERDMNGCSIGIELQNNGYEAYREAQMEGLIALLNDIKKRHSVPIQNYLAHSDIAPDRKDDPGAHFDWQRLAQEGFGLFIGDGDINLGGQVKNNSKADLHDLLTKIGYDPAAKNRIAAFQRHHHPSTITNRYHPITHIKASHIAGLIATTSIK